MKKILTGIASSILILSLGMTALATGTVTGKGGSKEIDVQAKAVYINPDNIYIAPVSDGKASLTTADGTVINITSNDSEADGMAFNVIEMVNADKEAYSWISGIISGFCDKFTAYDIYFTDKDGNRVDVTSGVAVSITTPDGYTNVKVYTIGASEKPEEISSEQSGENTVFTAKCFGYYVLAEKANGGTTGPTKPVNPDSPPTGETSNMALWLALMFISGGALTICCIKKRT